MFRWRRRLLAKEVYKESDSSVQRAETQHGTVEVRKLREEEKLENGISFAECVVL